MSTLNLKYYMITGPLKENEVCYTYKRKENSIYYKSDDKYSMAIDSTYKS